MVSPLAQRCHYLVRIGPRSRRPTPPLFHPWKAAKSAAVLLVCAAAFGQPPPETPGAVNVPGLVVSQPLNIICQQPPSQTAGKINPSSAPPQSQGQPPSQQAGVKTPSPETPPSEEQAKTGEEGAAEQPSNRPPWYSIHGQSTFIYQGNFPFRDPYDGPNSAVGRRMNDQTATGTLYFDVPPWQNGEIIFDPEFSGGTGIDGTLGFAGFPNGEATRTGKAEPTAYVARAFYRHTFEFEGESEKVEDAANEIAGIRQRNRLQISVGKMSAEDVLDDNLYSHDPRTQFLNWSLMYTGAWDYPANSRGYTYGALFDYSTMFYAVRYGIFARADRGQRPGIDPHFLKAHGQIAGVPGEFHPPGPPRAPTRVGVSQHGGHGEVPGRPRGNARRSGHNRDATPTGTSTASDSASRRRLTRDLGFFLRAGWNDGQTESWAFTEIDATAAAGFLLKGTPWGRPADAVGLAGVMNGLSDAHKDYLAAGGLGFIIGDGRLNYAPEEIAEAFYNWQAMKGLNITLDLQGVNNPAYNQDRGPVVLMALRTCGVLRIGAGTHGAAVPDPSRRDFRAGVPRRQGAQRAPEGSRAGKKRSRRLAAAGFVECGGGSGVLVCRRAAGRGPKGH